MSLFGEQLQNRTRIDRRAVDMNLKRLGDAVTGREDTYSAEDRTSAENIRQIESVCRYLGVETPEKPRECETLGEQIDVCLQPSGATKRRIELNDIWWRDGDGPIVAQRAGTAEAVALLPNRFRGYHFIDGESGKPVPVGKKDRGLFEKDAWCIYKPLPNEPLSGSDFMRFLVGQLNRGDIALLVAAMLFYTLFGTITSFATGYVFSEVIPSGQQALLVSLGVLLVCAAVGKWLLNITRKSVTARMSTRLDVVEENAVYARVIRLPVSFFNDKSAGGLTTSVMSLSQIPSILVNTVFGTFLQVACSLIYVAQLFIISKPLVIPVLVIYVAEIALFVITVLQERKQIERRLAGEQRNSGLVYAFLSGIQKIKIAGCEDRAFAKWMESYSEKTKATYKILWPASLRSPLITAFYYFGLLWLYLIAYGNGLSLGEFTAFSSAFGMAMSAISSLSTAGTSIASLSPILKLAEPILQAVPEETSDKRCVTSLSGKIELTDVVFGYSEDGPAILDGLDLAIEPGEYLAVVGPSGCGKTTLVKLLLGFEKPQQGAVYYDGYDLESLDKHSMRQRIGTVLQGGKLFTGDIYSNITISAPSATLADAWDAAEKAGLADDIRSMPMGMDTVIAEGGGGISGGQKQRLLIARAICPKPSILILDEATSALDNLTQQIVTESMDAMECTRIVIAHRLSTIRECDRIIVLDQGKIAEDGTYDELFARGGLFTELVNRQLIEEADCAL